MADQSSAPMSVPAQTRPHRLCQQLQVKPAQIRAESERMAKRRHPSQPVDAQPAGMALMEGCQAFQNMRRMGSTHQVITCARTQYQDAAERAPRPLVSHMARPLTRYDSADRPPSGTASGGLRRPTIVDFSASRPPHPDRGGQRGNIDRECRRHAWRTHHRSEQIPTPEHQPRDREHHARRNDEPHAVR